MTSILFCLLLLFASLIPGFADDLRQCLASEDVRVVDLAT